MKEETVKEETRQKEEVVEQRATSTLANIQAEQTGVIAEKTQSMEDEIQDVRAKEEARVQATDAAYAEQSKVRQEEVYKLSQEATDEAVRKKVEGWTEDEKQLASTLFNLKQDYTRASSEDRIDIARESLDATRKSNERKLALSNAMAAELGYSGSNYRKHITGTYEEMDAAEQAIFKSMDNIQRDTDLAVRTNFAEYEQTMIGIEKAEREQIEKMKSDLEARIYKIQEDEAKTSAEKQKAITDIMDKADSEVKEIKSTINDWHIRAYDGLVDTNNKMYDASVKEQDRMLDEMNSIPSEVNSLYDRLL